MLIPSLAHGMGLVFLLGSNGVLTNVLGLSDSFSIYGFQGIVAGSVLYSFPSAFLLLYDVLKYEDYSAYEAANVLGIPKWSQFLNITLPYLRKPLISAVFATFTLVITDYGVPLMVGGKTVTLSTLMYQEVIGLLNFNTGAAIGFVLLIPAVAAFLVDVLNRDAGRMSFVTRPFELRPNKMRDAFGYVQFLNITLPYLRKPLISAVFATFTLVITDYGVPLMVGGKTVTLSTLMYQEVIGLLNFNTGAAIGFVLLIPAVAAFLVDVLNRDAGRMSFVTRPFELRPNKMRDAFGYVASAVAAIAIVLPLASFALVSFVRKYPVDMSFPFELRPNKMRDAFGYVASAVAAIAIVLPLASFALVSFVRKYPVDMSFTLDNIGRSLNLNVGDYWLNSIFIAVAVSALGTVLAYFAGYITARMGGRFARALHLVCITTLAIPGIVLGLSYVGFFKGTFIYGTFALLILVNLIHFFASPYLMAYNSLGKVNANLEAVGATLGIGRMSMIKDVLIPQTTDTVLEMFSYFFVNCMVTISAVAFLSTTLDMPLALLITDLDTQRLTECAAFVSLVILVTNIAVKSALAGVEKLVSRKQRLEYAHE